MFKLVIQDDEGKTTVVPLIRDEITIGRKEGNTIRLTERNVSRRHARILRNNGEVQIEDLGSYNGIRVNNARIAERVSLRVSDQVQIGDYKLYLKAEGVEQVDDARTMPIERVDTANTTTDVMPAAPAAAAVSAPTAPMAIQTPAPGTLPPAAQLIGDPNRTLVAIADPQGRPVATPAQVAAVLSSPVGYGRLVVLSSNFAGKEFELSRPQMIIGRTDENDIVINHRSISRNHAKLTRDPENNRYTISDLQSSNGVRVNGQDYGKVELRRGDVIDLGHVRLRFVEPGEDFIFARDAVITDVPDTSSKKPLFIALGLAAIVVVGVIVVLLMRKDDKPGSSANGNNMATQTDAANIVAQAPDAAEVVPVIDAAEEPKDDPASAIRVRCKEAIANNKWPDAIVCGEELKKHAPEEGQNIYTQAHAEQKAEVSFRRLQDAVKNKNYAAAAAALKEIGEGSVYRKDAVAANEKLLQRARDEVTARAKQYATNCASYDKAMRQFKSSGVPESVITSVKNEHGCTQVATTRPDRDPPPDRERPCANADDDYAKGQEAFGKGKNQEALTLLDKAYACKGDARILQLAFAAACKSKNLGKARQFWKKMSPGMQQAVASFCPNNGILLEQLNKP